MNDRVTELDRLEAELIREEVALREDLSRLGADATAIEARARNAKMMAMEAAASGSSDGGVAARLSTLALPPLAEGASALARAQQAREMAVRARVDATQQVRRLIDASKQRLATLGQQLRQDEEMVLKLMADARTRNEQAAQRAMQERAMQERAQQHPTPPLVAPPSMLPRPQHSGATAMGNTQLPQGVQRRQQKRVPVRAVVDFNSDHNFFTGFSANISEGGIFVATCDVLPVGTEVDLAFTLPNGGHVQTHGVVRWVRELDDKAPEVFPGIGVQFTRLDDGSAKEIHSFVSVRDPLFYVD